MKDVCCHTFSAGGIPSQWGTEELKGRCGTGDMKQRGEGAGAH